MYLRSMVAVLVGLVTCMIMTGVAASIASARPSTARLGTSVDSALRADYSTDPQGARFAPIEPEIIAAARDDGERVAAPAGDSSGEDGSVEFVPIHRADPTPGPSVTPSPEPDQSAAGAHPSPTDFETPTPGPTSGQPAKTPTPTPVSYLPPTPTPTPHSPWLPAPTQKPTNTPYLPTIPPTPTPGGGTGSTPPPSSATTPPPPSSAVTPTPTPLPSSHAATPTAQPTPQLTPKPTPQPTPKLTPKPTPTPAATLTPPPGGTASTVNFSASADSLIQAQGGGSNFGGASVLRVDPHPTNAQRTLVRFDLSSIPAGAQVGSAKLTLCPTKANANAAGRIHEAHRALADWGESAVNWANQPQYLGLPTGSSAYGGGLQCVSFDVTADVAAWVAGASNFGWLLKDRVEDLTGCEVSYASRENASTTLRPLLTVTFTQ